MFATPISHGGKEAFGAARQVCAGCVIHVKKTFDRNVSELRLASCSTTICCCDGDTKGDIDEWSNMLAPVEPLTIDI